MTEIQVEPLPQTMPSWRTKQTIFFVLIMLCILVAFGWHFLPHKAEDPTQVCLRHASTLCQSAHSEAEIPASDPNLTARGHDVLIWMITHRSEHSATGGISFGSYLVEGDACSYPFTSDLFSGEFQLVRHGDQWQFDNVRITRENGQETDISVGYLVEHPWLAKVRYADWKGDLQVAESIATVLGFITSF